MKDSTLVSVRNRNNGFTGYAIQDKGIRRNFSPGETKKVSLEELKELQYQPGGEYTLNHLLVIEDAEALDALNMRVQPEYNYTEADIRNLLWNGTVDQLKDFLDFAPDGAIEIAKDIAIDEEIPDIRKRDAISKATDFNINGAIDVNHAAADEEEVVEQPQKKRRAELPNVGGATSNQRRASLPETSTKKAAPNYKVVK